MIKRYSKNLDGRDFVVGDIHGAYTKLQEALNKIGFNPDKDRLFCTGDLVDRGSESEQATDWLFKPWFHSVRGNHEQLTIDAYDSGGGSDREYLHQINGGYWYSCLPNDHRANIAEVFRTLPYVIEVETDSGLVGVIHAETSVNDWLLFKRLLEAQDDVTIEQCIWGRSKIKAKDESVIKGIYKVYVGHTIVDNPITLGNVEYIDTIAWHDSGYFAIKEL